jgi:predicted SprT family Zn-dependent metalloprotease
MKTENKNINRETWLNLMIDKSVPLFDNAGFKISDIREKLKASCSVMVGMRKSKKFNAIGQHLPTEWNKDSNHELLISPVLEDEITVVGVLIHEMVHAIQRHLYGNDVQPHGKEFRKIALAVGLTGKMTATTESPELKIQIEKWVSEIGKYPHSKVNFETRKKQTTRLLKLECEHCGFICRASSGAINNFGYPSHCGDEMEIAA